MFGTFLPDLHTVLVPEGVYETYLIINRKVDDIMRGLTVSDGFSPLHEYVSNNDRIEED